MKKLLLFVGLMLLITYFSKAGEMEEAEVKDQNQTKQELTGQMEIPQEQKLQTAAVNKVSKLEDLPIYGYFRIVILGLDDFELFT
ncbi:MAG: hypothetical protein HC842_08440 [Cytophagales bacterium]|nr:hypothetical protein [Cytophagales bacterium]